MAYRQSELIIPDRMDIIGLTEFLRAHEHCNECNLSKKCDGCPYVLFSTHDNTLSVDERIRCVGLGKAFAPYFPYLNALELSNIGRGYILYFDYCSWMGYTFPFIPPYDFFGNKTKLCTSWQMHHYKTKYNDNATILVLPQEHGRFEGMSKYGDFNWLDILKRYRKSEPWRDTGVVIHYSKFKRNKSGYYSQWEQDGNGLWVLKEGVNLQDFYDIGIG